MFATQKRNGQNLKQGGIESGKFAFGQLPSLTFCPDGNHKSPRCLDLVQSHTILRSLIGTTVPMVQKRRDGWSIW